MIYDLAHVNINCTDIQESIAFYEKFGFEVIHVIAENTTKLDPTLDVMVGAAGYEDSHCYGVIMSLGDHPHSFTKLELLQYTQPATTPEPPRTAFQVGYCRMAIRCRDIQGRGRSPEVAWRRVRDRGAALGDGREAVLLLRAGSRRDDRRAARIASLGGARARSLVCRAMRPGRSSRRPLGPSPRAGGVPSSTRWPCPALVASTCGRHDARPGRAVRLGFAWIRAPANSMGTGFASVGGRLRGGGL